MLALSPGVSAQDVGGCAPITVGDGTGVFFLVLSDLCPRALADGYATIADLEQDDAPQELLVLVSGNSDQETRLVALVVANEVKAGGVDGHTWHAATARSPEQAGQDAEQMQPAPEPPSEPAPDDGE
jgi:hypothetical protein